MNKKYFSKLILLLALFLVVGASGGFVVNAEFTSENAQTLTVELNDDFFNPKEIVLPVGKPTTLVVKNVGAKVHTFTVNELKIDVEVEPGKEKTIIVTPEKAGTYQLICRYHFKQGMVGSVIVK